MKKLDLRCGDCLVVLKDMPDDHFDSVVSDPPYGLSSDPDPMKVLRAWMSDEPYVHGTPGFMSAEWDSFVPGPLVWKEVFRVLKPGGHLVAFSGTRTLDLMSMAIRLGGFEIRDVITWHYATGFAKPRHIGPDIDAIRGNERVPLGTTRNSGPDGEFIKGHAGTSGLKATYQTTRGFSEWEDWRTGIKPATEPMTLARKPISEANVALNVERWGTGALNIGACRVDGKFPANVMHDGIMDEAWGKFFFQPKPDSEEKNDGVGDGGNTHTTVKPTDLMAELCKLLTRPGGRILDPFMGSGTTGRGAVREGFEFTGIDLNPEFVNISRRRIEAVIERLATESSRPSLDDF